MSARNEAERGVAYLTSYPSDPRGPSSGPQRVMREVIAIVAARGVDAEVWCAPYRRADRRAPGFVDEGVPVRFIGPMKAIGIAVRHPEHVLHIGSFSLFHALPLIARRLVGLFRTTGSVVYTAHGLLAVETRHGARRVPLITSWVERLLLDRSDRVVVLSTQVAELIKEHYRIPTDRIEVIPPAVPTAFATLERDPSHDASHGPRLLFAGELRRVKGLDVLAGALERLHARDPDAPWSLAVAGGTSPTWELPPQWADLQSLGRITMLGRLSVQGLVDAYGTARCLVLPSSYEPFGMVVLEAMAGGTPAIVSDRVGARDLIDHGSTGLVVPHGDVSTLTAALESALDEPDRFAAMGAAARQRALSWSSDDVAARYVAIYER